MAPTRGGVVANVEPTRFERYTPWSSGMRQKYDPHADNALNVSVWHEGTVVCESCGALVPDNRDYRRRHDIFHDGED